MTERNLNQQAADHLEISAIERERRLRMFQKARANTMLDDTALTQRELDDADALMMKWVNGKISWEDYKDLSRLLGLEEADELVMKWVNDEITWEEYKASSRLFEGQSHNGFWRVKWIEELGVRIAEIEIRESPVHGKFDADHLREIHRRLFQHMEKNGHGELHVPGQYRPEDVSGSCQVKDRLLRSVNNMETSVVYSSMDEVAREAIDEALKRADPQKLSKLDSKGFANAIGSLYADLDYLHPFKSGNSRTLRVFTEQLAKESGYGLNWEVFNQNQSSRDYLYIGRDMSVAQRALLHVEDENAQEKLLASLDQFENAIPLGETLHFFKTVCPSRASME